jgi:hypothetical protein
MGTSAADAKWMGLHFDGEGGGGGQQSEII